MRKRIEQIQGILKNYDRTDEYYIYIFNKMLDIAPLTGLSAGILITIVWLNGLFDFVSLSTLVVFDIVCVSYYLIAFILRKIGIVKNGTVDQKRLLFCGIVLDLMIILQWNLISYMFPIRSFWGFAPMFVLLSAFLFNTKVVLVDIVGIAISIAISWSIGDTRLLPVLTDQFYENLILRITGLVISFSIIYILTLFAERFTRFAKENYKFMEAKNRELENMGRDVIDFTADIIEERDSTSGSHVKRLKYYTQVLAQQVRVMHPEYGLDDEIIKEISLACVLHDVGKIAISDSILLKPGKLTPEEFEIIKTHTVKGAKIIEKLPESVGEGYKQYCKEICQFHHEKYDGKGYPVGLVGDQIPISAQIVSMVDCYDALTNERPYKNALPGEVAIKMILDGECGVFSDKLKECLLACKEQFLHN